MNKGQLSEINCSVAGTLQSIGEGWTILIIREAFLGTRRFDDFQKHLGIARNILSARLKKLAAEGIFTKTALQAGGRRQEYRLTEKGHELMPVLIALMQWGDRWVTGNDEIPLQLLDRRDQQEIQAVCVMAADGRKLSLYDLLMVAGPGASEDTRQRLMALQQKGSKKKHGE